MLKQRIITAAILIPITLLVLFYLPPAPFCVMTAIITLVGAWEWSNLMGLQKTSQRVLYLLVIAFVLSWMIIVPVALIFIVSSIWWIFAFMLVVLYPRCSSWWGSGVFWRGLMGIVVLSPCWAAINYIRNQNDGIYTLLFLFVLIWGADSAAYFTGKRWGKTKLAPHVSPGKSVQGFLGAIIFCTIIAVAALILCQIPPAMWPWAIALSIITVMFSVVGDLFESMMKRQCGLKDSGNIFPGHGGLLDRIDSLTAAAPVFVMGGLLLGMYLD
jgi:phosphatidate cytidylyltransferase